MTNRISRRELLRDIGLTGAAGALSAAQGTAMPAQEERSQTAKLIATPSPALLDDLRQHHVELVAGEMVVTFDRRYGSIFSITRKGDPYQANFMGNEVNTPGADPSDSRWTGDVVATVWELSTDGKSYPFDPNRDFYVPGKWRRELTGKSHDTRRARFDNGVLNVRYDRESMNDEGIRSFKLDLQFRAGDGSSLLWDITIENVTNNILEIGELGLPLMVNDDYAALLGKGWRTPVIQKLIHEQKMLVHHFVAGHSSYSLVQRPLGDPPFLLVHPTQETPWECLYKEPNSAFARDVEGWAGPDILAIHSWAVKNQRRWFRNPWVNGHTSLLLQPGEKRSFQVRFALIPSYEAIRDEVGAAGNLGIRVMPSMVVQEDTDARVELSSKASIDKIDLLSDNITVKDQRATGAKTLLTLSFKGRGQKTLKLHYGERWTNLHFYCIEDAQQLLKARARFIVEREFYENPEDPYHRHHMFLPFDHRVGSTFLDSDTVWEVGGSDEAGFSEPLFLAEKNVYLPSRKEVETLETYVADCLFKYIQDPQTYLVRASLYWKERYPSAPWGWWTKQRSETTFRTYNYVHPACIYFALFRIGKYYGLLTRKTPEEYLRMAYQTCMKWFTTGPYRHIGLMEGSNSIDILNAIKAEGWQQEYNSLFEQMKECEKVFVEDPYPYSSELLIDQTAHEQVYFFTQFFGDQAKNAKTLQVIKALRGGNQPVWFRYGNDKRRDRACWYTESLNGLALLNAFESSGDSDAFVKGYAGVMSVMRNVLPDGMGFDHFIWSAGLYDEIPRRTFEGGEGLWGFVRAAKCYIINDPSFGLIGCGCRAETSANEIRAYPKDGLRKRVRFVDQKMDIEVTPGEIEQVALREDGRSIEIDVIDPSGFVKSAHLTLRGLAAGDYRVTARRFSKTVASSGVLQLSIPIAQARKVNVRKL
ncbi:MAG: DUF5695 domain-containing protein [Terriglobia bacterium]